MSTQKQTEVAEEHIQMSTTVGYFDKVLEALESFRDEGIIKFTGDAVFGKITDPATVAMCIARIEGQALNSLEVVNADAKEVGLRFEKIRDCLSGTSNTSELEVTWPVSDSGTSMIRLDVIDEDLQFEVSTLDPDTVPAMPQNDSISHPTRVAVRGADLKKSVSHAGKILDGESGSIVFETYEDIFQIRASDKVEGRFQKQFHQSGPSDEAELGEHQTKIDIGYLDDINKVLGRGDEVTVHIKQDNPVRLDVNLDDNGDAQVIYVIAPRLKTD